MSADQQCLYIKQKNNTSASQLINNVSACLQKLLLYVNRTALRTAKTLWKLHRVVAVLNAKELINGHYAFHSVDSD